MLGSVGSRYRTMSLHAFAYCCHLSRPNPVSQGILVGAALSKTQPQRKGQRPAEGYRAIEARVRYLKDVGNVAAITCVSESDSPLLVALLRDN